MLTLQDHTVTVPPPTLPTPTCKDTRITLCRNTRDTRDIRDTLPIQYEVCDLVLKDAYIINETWAYKSEHSLDKIKDIIAYNSCCKGIRLKGTHTVGGTLVSWCLINNYGALSTTYTVEVSKCKTYCTYVTYHTHYTH